MKDQISYSRDTQRLPASYHNQPSAQQRQEGKRRSDPGGVAGQGADRDPVVNDLMIRRILAALTNME